MTGWFFLFEDEVEKHDDVTMHPSWLLLFLLID